MALPLLVIYLDYQASTPMDPRVRTSMEPYFAEVFASGGSIHGFGLKVRDAIEEARTQVAAFLNAESPEEIIFTSGGTESANLAVKGAALAAHPAAKRILVTAIDHPAVMQSVAALEPLGFRPVTLPVDSLGRVDPDAFAKALTDDTALACVHHCNHDIGTIQAVAEIGTLARAAGVPLFVDATSSAGWLPMDVRSWGASLVSLAPHRFHGPKGAGVLYRRRRCRLACQIHGGIQEGGLRAGTENVPGIVGAGVACEWARREWAERATHVTALQADLWQRLSQSITGLRLNGPTPGPDRSPAQLNVSVEGVEGEGLALKLDMLGVAVGSGPSCVSRSMKSSPVLEAIGVPHALAQASILLSLSRENTAAEIVRAAELFDKAVAHLRQFAPRTT